MRLRDKCVCKRERERESVCVCVCSCKSNHKCCELLTPVGVKGANKTSHLISKKFCSAMKGKIKMKYSVLKSQQTLLKTYDVINLNKQMT